MKNAYRSLFLLCLAWLGAVAALSYIAGAQTSITSAPAFPKYKVMGVVYAPPGSASSVTYGNSNLVGSTDTMSTTNSSTKTVSTSVTAGVGVPLFWSVTATYNYSDSWTESTEYSNSIAIQTTIGNSVATMGPISSSLGVDHDNDVIYIWLNPVLTGSSSGSTLDWTGMASNSCDANNPSAPLTIDQAVNGCDPNQYPYLDIVGIPVWCLKNPFSPVQGCAQWLPYTSRSWDKSSWGTDPSTGLPLGPGLTMRDYADILQADPFVTFNGNAVNVCHPTYGPGLDPNESETVAAPLAPANGYEYTVTDNGTSSTRINYADPYDPYYYNGTIDTYNSAEGTPTGFFPRSCNSNNTTGTMTRFQPYGDVEYPVPGPNGLPSTYVGTFQYSDTQTNTYVATDTHTVSQGVSVTAGTPGTGGSSQVGFIGSVTAGTSNSTTWEQQSSNANTTGSTSSAAYSITGPQLSDNYEGPATYGVYLDNVYGTYAFYSDMEAPLTPAMLGTIGISVPSAICSATGPYPCHSFAATQIQSLWSQTSSAVTAVTLTNDSQYPMIMAGPAVTFSDPGFQLVEGNGNYQDGCSNVQLQPAQTCTLYVEFAPVPSDMPNPIYNTTKTILANMIAAGTVNFSSAGSYQNILVTNYGVVSGVAQPPANQYGATLFPATQNASVPNAYIFPGTYNYSTTNLQEQFIFTNMSNAPITIAGYPNGITLTDSGDFAVLSDSCSGNTISTTGASGDTCTFTLNFSPKSMPESGLFATRISVTSNTGAVSAIAGATVNAAPSPFTVTPQSPYYQNTGSIVIPLAGATASGSQAESNYGWAMPVTITNKTGVTLTFAQPTEATFIYEDYPSREGMYTCEYDAGTTVYGNLYFSPCLYETSATTTTDETVGSMVTDTPIPAPWGYVYGQLGGTPGGEVESPGWGPNVGDGTLSGSPHAYSSGTDSGDNSWTMPELTCQATLSAFSSCTAAVVAFLPSNPDDQSWNSIVFNLNGPTYTPSNTFVANFSLPISATFQTAAGAFLFNQNLPVVVDGSSVMDSTPGATTQVVTVSGSEQRSQVTTAATPATGAITLSTVSTASSSHTAATESRQRDSSGSPDVRTPVRMLPANPTFTQSTLSVGVGGFTKAVNVPADTAINDAAATLAAQLNIAGSPVAAVANGATISLTSLSTGTGANLPLSTFVIGNYRVNPSGNTLTGGQNAGTTTNYDSGTVQLTTAGLTVSVPWGSTSTPQSIATALAAAVNQTAGAYWTATVNGAVITLTSVSSTSTNASSAAGSAHTASRRVTAAVRRVSAAATPAAAKAEATTSTTSSPVQITVIDNAGFATPSFSATTN